MTTVEELRKKIVHSWWFEQDVLDQVDALIVAAEERGKEKILAIFRYTVERRMKALVSATTPEELARLKREIESHKDDTALEA